MTTLTKFYEDVIGTTQDGKQTGGIFITGVTGFVGMALMEKILRMYPDTHIYMIIRPNKWMTVDERFSRLKSEELFDSIRDEDGKLKDDNLHVLQGDLNGKNFGLSDENVELLRNAISLIFHCAASLDFEADFQPNIEVNTFATLELLKFSKTCKNLKAFVYVSSAYANAKLNTMETVKEVMYYRDKFDNLENLLISVSNDRDNFKNYNLEKFCMDDHANSYTCSKHLAEHLVCKEKPNIRVTIVRPSMILGVWKTPIPGWTVSKNGPQGFLMGAAKGVIRRLPINNEIVYDYIPVDVVINTMMAAAWKAATMNPAEWEKQQDIPIYHVTSSTGRNAFTWQLIDTEVQDLLNKYPSEKAVWYPRLKFLPSLKRYHIAAFFFHIIPAFFFDLFLMMQGHNPKVLNIHKRVNRSLDLLEPFIFKEWFFDNSKTLELEKTLTEDECKHYYLSVGKLKWLPFFKRLSRGVRRYLLHEKDSTLERARARNTVLYFADWVLKLALLYAIGHIIYSISLEPQMVFTIVFVLVICGIYHAFF